MNVDTFICPECGEPRAGRPWASFHKPSCPRALGRSSGRGLNPQALETLAALIKPSTPLWAVRRHLSRSGGQLVADLFVVSCPGGKALAIGPVVALALGLEFDQAFNGIPLRVEAGIEGVIARLTIALFGPDAPMIDWRWI